MFTVMPSDSKCFFILASTAAVGLGIAATRSTFLPLKIGFGCCAEAAKVPRAITPIEAISLMFMKISSWNAIRNTTPQAAWSHAWDVGTTSLCRRADRPQHSRVKQCVPRLGQIIDGRIVYREHCAPCRCDELVSHRDPLLEAEDGPFMRGVRQRRDNSR